jgi:AraC-like DNA-binding protein
MSLFSAILLIGAVQGTVLAIILFGRPKRSAADAVLGSWMGLFSLDIIVLLASTEGLYRYFPHFLNGTAAFTFLYGPFFYFYVLFLIRSKKKWSPRDILHLIPFVFTLALLTPFFLLPGDQKILSFEAARTAKASTAGMLFGAFRATQGTIYVLLGNVSAWRSAKGLKDRISDPRVANARWLSILGAFQAAIWVCALAAAVFLFMVPAVGRFLDQLIWPLAALSVESIGILAILRSGSFPRPAGEIDADAVKYRKTRLDPAEAREFESLVRQTIAERKPFLKPDLSLEDLAAETGIRAYQLSQVINDRLGSNFFSLINGLRVEEAKRRLTDPDESGKSVLEIAFACGFSSKASFNALFKRFAGTTPSEFRKTRPTL